LYGILQVKRQELTLGYLVLIKWSFDELWEVLVYLIEYYVGLIQQRQDHALMREQFCVFGLGVNNSSVLPHPLWKHDSSVLQLKDLRVSFEKEQGVFHEIFVPEFTLRAGEHVGIVGPSGVGKTTVLNILLNMVPYSGEYTIDDTDASQAEFSSRQCTVINSSDPLFKISLLDNLLLGREIRSEKISEVISGVQASNFVTDLHVRVGSNDFNLSSGQEQRIRLARGLLQESEIYLLDEPFVGIDVATRAEIMRYLTCELAGKTVVLVTHNCEELVLVENVYEFNNGVLRKSKGGI